MVKSGHTRCQYLHAVMTTTKAATHLALEPDCLLIAAQIDHTAEHSGPSWQTELCCLANNTTAS